jgi:hypothetical protein
MNKIIYLSGLMTALFVGTSISAISANNIDSKSVRHSFHHAKNIHRFEKKNGFVEYDFMMKGKYVSALYDQSGNLVEADFSTSFKDLPAKAQEFITNKFSNPVYTDITRVQYKNNSCYRVRLEANGMEYSIIATPTGEVTMGY